MILSDIPSLTLPQALEQYEQAYLAPSRLATRTRREYRNDLTSVITFLTAQSGLSSPTGVTKRHLDGYLGYLEARGYSVAARRRQYASIRSFFLFLLAKGAIAADPTLRLIPPERDEPPPRALTEAECRRLRLAVQQDRSAAVRRDTALIELLLQTGLTLSETARLTMADLDLPPTTITSDATGVVRVLRHGRPARTLPLSGQTCQLLRDYLAVRPPVSDPTLFLSKFGAGMRPRSIERAIAKHLHAAGISDASAHTLRHTFAVGQIQRQARPEAVQALLGHATLDATLRYVDLVNTWRGGLQPMHGVTLPGRAP